MDLTIEQKIYCSDECPIRRAKKKELLDAHNSAYDAVLEMHWFVEKCAETCERCKRQHE